MLRRGATRDSRTDAPRLSPSSSSFYTLSPRRIMILPSSSGTPIVSPTPSGHPLPTPAAQFSNYDPNSTDDMDDVAKQDEAFLRDLKADLSRCTENSRTLKDKVALLEETDTSLQSAGAETKQITAVAEPCGSCTLWVRVPGELSPVLRGNCRSLPHDP